jgi:hypothetical protein
MNSFTPSIFSTGISAPVRLDQVTPTINPPLDVWRDRDEYKTKKHAPFE